MTPPGFLYAHIAMKMEWNHSHKWFSEPLQTLGLVLDLFIFGGQHGEPV